VLRVLRVPAVIQAAESTGTATAKIRYGVVDFALPDGILATFQEYERAL
jgi:hypothetical protein